MRYSNGLVTAVLISIMNIPIVFAADTVNNTFNYDVWQANQTAYYCSAYFKGEKPPVNNTIALAIEAGIYNASEQNQHCDWLIHGGNLADRAK